MYYFHIYELVYVAPRITALKGLQPIITGCKDNAFIWIDNKKVREILFELKNKCIFVALKGGYI